MEKEELAANQEALIRRGTKQPSAKKNEIFMEPKYCKGCGLCVYSCPTGTLLLVEDSKNKWGVSVKVDAPEFCIGCKICESQCPDFAIFVNYEK